MKFRNDGEELQLLFDGLDITIPKGDFEVGVALGNYLIFQCNKPGWEKEMAGIFALDDPNSIPEKETKVRKITPTDELIKTEKNDIKIEENKEEKPKVAGIETLPKK